MESHEGSEYDRLFYPFLFERGKADANEVKAQVEHSTLEKCREIIQLRQQLVERSSAQLLQVAQVMTQAFAQGATLFAFGNGGSATDAQDLVTDLLNPPFPDWKPLPALALTNDTAVITAVGNDVGFDNIFARQIIAYAHPGDIAFGFSTSGNSANLLTAFAQAKKQGLLTVGISGYNGGKMARSPALDYCLVAESDHIPRIQEVHATVYHALLELIQTSLAYQKELL